MQTLGIQEMLHHDALEGEEHETFESVPKESQMIIDHANLSTWHLC